MAPKRSGNRSSGGSGHGRAGVALHLNDLTKIQCGKFMEDVVDTAVRRVPGLVDPNSPSYLGSRPDICRILSDSIAIAHPAAAVGRLDKDNRYSGDTFNNRWRMNESFQLRSGPTAGWEAMRPACHPPTTARTLKGSLIASTVVTILPAPLLGSDKVQVLQLTGGASFSRISISTIFVLVARRGDSRHRRARRIPRLGFPGAVEARG